MTEPIFRPNRATMGVGLTGSNGPPEITGIGEDLVVLVGRVAQIQQDLTSSNETFLLAVEQLQNAAVDHAVAIADVQTGLADIINQVYQNDSFVRQIQSDMNTSATWLGSRVEQLQEDLEAARTRWRHWDYVGAIAVALSLVMIVLAVLLYLNS